MAPPARGNDGKARVQAAKAVTGRDSRTMLEQVSELKRIAADDDEDPMVRQHAAEALIELNEDGKVNGRHQKVKAAQGRARLTRWAEHPDTPDAGCATAAADELAALGTDLPVAELAKETALAVDRVQKLEAASATERVGWADVDPLMRQKHAVRKLVDLLRREHGWWERFDPAEIGQYADDTQWGAHHQLPRRRHRVHHRRHHNAGQRRPCWPRRRRRRCPGGRSNARRGG